jgi:hypothetical protein
VVRNFRPLVTPAGTGNGTGIVTCRTGTADAYRVARTSRQLAARRHPEQGGKRSPTLSAICFAWQSFE